MPRSERPHMPGYGISEGTEGLLDWSWGSDRLERTRNYWVVTASADGRPHAMPAWGLWMPERDQFFLTSSPHARKVRNLRANPRVVITADDTVEVVSLEGIATEVSPAEETDLVLRWANKYGAVDEAEGPTSQQLAEFVGETAAFVVSPDRAFGLIERPEEFGPKATKWVWDAADQQ